jgi:CRISPR-associated protein Cmr6
VSSRRNKVKDLTVESTTNAGLWLDKYIGDQDRNDVNARRNLVQQVAGISTPDVYGVFYRSWRETLAAVNAQTAEAKVQARMAVGFGDESVLETSVQLHHTYGVPFVPGSALKGLAAAYTRKRLPAQDWGVTTPAYRTLFGDTVEAGYVTFFDALYVPNSGHQGRALHPDVLTVHHKAYYEGKPQPPADWDSPTPVPFLSATGRYLIAVGGQAEWAAWTDAAFSILAAALAELGVGAKTSSGYGRLKVDQKTLQRPFPTVATPQHLPAEPPSTQSAEQARPVAPAVPADRPPTWRSGIVREYQPDKGRGRLVDSETNEELRFDRDAIEDHSWSPGKNTRVKYTIADEAGRHQIIKIRRS